MSGSLFYMLAPPCFYVPCFELSITVILTLHACYFASFLLLCRFFYASGTYYRQQLPKVYKHAKVRYDPSLWANHVYAPLTRYPFRNDAFGTIMQWLHGRMKDVSQRYKRQSGGEAKQVQ